MVRSTLRAVALVVLFSSSAPLLAAEKTDPEAPSAAVAAAWVKEAEQRGPSPAAFKVMYGSYTALTTVDVISTVAARERGAREVNPLLSGGYGQAAMTKAAFAAGTIAGVKALEKKSRKAAFITMVAINVATAAVAANNFRNAHRLNQR